METPTQVPNPSRLKRLKELLDAQDNKCYLCGEVLLIDEANLDHEIPRSLGGRGKENFKATHIACNTLKDCLTIDFKNTPKELPSDEFRNFTPALKLRRAAVFSIIETTGGCTVSEIIVKSNIGYKLVRKTVDALYRDKLINRHVVPDVDAINKLVEKDNASKLTKVIWKIVGQKK